MTPYLDDGDVTLYQGDCLEVLRELPAKSVHMCATSPPFYGLRDYGTGEWEGGDPECAHAPKMRPGSGRADGVVDERGQRSRDGVIKDPKTCGKCGARRVDRQIGLEETPDMWVDRLVAVFREVRRVLRDDGTLWVEIGDSYTAGKQGRTDQGRDIGGRGGNYASGEFALGEERKAAPGYKPKDLLGQPWLLAFALRADGWYLRSEIIWAKPNPMPESVTDRPTKSHSTVFLLSKQPRYFYDADAIREPPYEGGAGAAYYAARGKPQPASVVPNHTGTGQPKDGGNSGLMAYSKVGVGANARSVWHIEQDTLDPSLPPEKPRGPDGRRVTHVQKGDNSSQHRDGERWPNPDGANARSVWQIATEPTPFAHFATWPQALVRRMILAGTSERGCCPECGARWERQSEREREYHHTTSAPGKSKDGPYAAQTGDGAGTHDIRHGVITRTTTTGWATSCTHGLEPVPCTVLDPFAGSGTTNLVARNHGRHSIGIELNAEYLQIAARRLQQLSLLT